jgi:serine protease AprX
VTGALDFRPLRPRPILSTSHSPLWLLLAAFLLWPAVEKVSSGPEPLPVDPFVLETATIEGTAEFLLELAEQADLSMASHLPDKQSKGRFVFSTLTETALRSQEPLLSWLEQRQVEHRPYWIANMIWISADTATMLSLAQREDVGYLHANPRTRLDEPSTGPTLLTANIEPEWNIVQIGADAVWQLGVTGEGVVVGGQDTGYQWDHPALQNQYRGWNGSSADHNFNWHDAIHDSDGPCGADAQEPCDDWGHGTHTMGTAVGFDGGDNRIGVAPGARWIGCRNMDQGVGTPATYAECFQWFVAPTDLENENANPDLAPHVIVNSWSCPPSEGCTEPDVLRTVVENVRAAGILTVQSAGNSGPSCSTVGSPAAIYEASFTVGATADSSDAIAPYSSRGPVTVDGSGRRKPDVVAPGSSIKSATLGDTYKLSSGTSMAAPHVAGLAALLISDDPALAGQVDQIEWLMERSALAQTTEQTCADDTPGAVPNNTYGYGRVDALAAILLSREEARLYLPWVGHD